MTLSEEQREVGGNWECMSQIQPPNTAASASWEDYLSRHMILLLQTQEQGLTAELMAQQHLCQWSRGWGWGGVGVGGGYKPQHHQGSHTHGTGSLPPAAPPPGTWEKIL